MDKYCIRDGYKARTEYCALDKSKSKDELQDEVYHKAKEIQLTHNYKSILDIGTGSGYKLLKYFKDDMICGTEVPPNLDWLRKTYPEYTWIDGMAAMEIQTPYNIIICADVIEHVLHPELLIEYILKIDFNYLVISTPDRDKVQMKQRGYLHDGPPNKPSHIREWSKNEFNMYMKQNFKVIEHYNDGYMELNQIAICQKRK